MDPNSIPCLPETAPFTPEQRAYLNGFFAGLFSRSPLPGIVGNVPARADGVKPLEPLTILFGSQTGNAEALAKRIAKEAGKRSFAPTVFDLAHYPPESLANDASVLLITSTYGDGEPPDNAKAFLEFLSSTAAPALPHLRFSVLALGDSNYEKFCECGKEFDCRLETLGARRIYPRVDCDVDYEEPFQKWLNGSLSALAKDDKPGSNREPLTPALSPEERESRIPSRERPVTLDDERSADARFPLLGERVRVRGKEATEESNVSGLHEVSVPLTPALSPSEEARENGSQSSVELLGSGPKDTQGLDSLSRHPTTGKNQGGARRETVPSIGHSKKNPFPAPLLTNRQLNAPGSAKETRHFEFSLEGSDLDYEVGDALGVVPANCPTLVDEILGALSFTGEESIPGTDGQTIALRDALLRQYEITKIPQALLRAMAERSGNAGLRALSVPGVNGELTKFLWGREVIDLLLGFPEAQFTPGEFVEVLRKLQPRLYSISSSPKANPGQVHLTIAIVRYESLGRLRRGVCSSFLADRVNGEGSVPVFVHKNKSFRLPPDSSRPLIMIGPGTGIAPFRAFLEERRAVGALGKNWLFFGDQHEKTDFLYRDELEVMSRNGTLTRLTTAFSRDQEQKLYVQQRILENAKELYAWLEDGGHFYVCGDASRMAKDVEKALHQVIEIAGNRTAEQAAEYVRRLQTEKRYQRDVY